jgi:hypothetical protein
MSSRSAPDSCDLLDFLAPDSDMTRRAYDPLCRRGADMARGGLSMRAKITKRVVDGAAPVAATYLVRDTEVKGFVLVVTPAGTKSYAVDYRVGSGRGHRSGG